MLMTLGVGYWWNTVPTGAAASTKYRLLGNSAMQGNCYRQWETTVNRQTSLHARQMLTVLHVK